MSTPLRANLAASSAGIRLSQILVVLSAVVWFAVVVAGLVYLWKYENKPGEKGSAPQTWPVASQIQPNHEQSTLIMVAHPQCPCTRASIGELAAIMAHCEGRLKAFVLFLKPDGAPGSWEKTDLWHSAARIPGVEVISDRNGDEARRFQTATSGHTLVYDLKGNLIFAGGITSSRGHSGDNAGRSSIVALINQEVPSETTTAVFGCPLFNPNDECRIPSYETSKH
jgi:hypothetical protein